MIPTTKEETAPKTKPKTMIAYWFSRDDGTTEHQKTPAEVGKTDRSDGTPAPCEKGLHASPTPFDALQYAAGCRLWEVEIPADSVPHGDPLDKYAAKSRRYLRSVDLRRVLVEFSCRQAEGVLDLFEKRYPDGKRPREAIEAAREYAKKQTHNVRAAAEAARAAEAMLNEMALSALLSDEGGTA